MRIASGRRSRRFARAVAAVMMIAVVGAAELPAAAAAVSQRWLERYGGGDYARALGISPDGSTVFITGSNGGRRTDGGDFVTVAYDAATGTKRWVGRYDGPAHGSDSAAALGVSADGSRVFVAGFSEGSDGNRQSATVAYDAATGAELWNARRAFNDYGVELGTSPDGSIVFVAGEHRGTRGDHSVTVAYAAESGRKLWIARRENGLVAALDVSPNGSKVFITGGTRGTVHYSNNFATLAYDAATGAQLWMRRYGPEHTGVAQAIEVSPNGSTVFVTGLSDDGSGIGSSTDYATVAYDATAGIRLWVQRYDGPDHQDDSAQALGVSPDGSTVFVTGESFAPWPSASTYATIAYDTGGGAELWVARYDGTQAGQDSPNAIVVSPDGSQVFVTGWTRGDPGTDVATVGYNAVTGLEFWSEQYDDPEGSSGTLNSLGISPDGSALFVSGSTAWPDSDDWTYTTIAYGVG